MQSVAMLILAYETMDCGDLCGFSALLTDKTSPYRCLKYFESL
ncbi:hypothetical protein LCGC14_0364010 [marine sediment metagenome]|uniref:Uncharacterized protein n=1 Tax=marine sediment metagenome TaxID=412755 RepID=A0A0F9TQ34_9ZZZZ